jgi:uncharacterized protein with FMN-binding domain
MNNRRQPQKTFNLGRAVKKFFLSAFVVFSFLLYATHKPFNAADSAVAIVSPTPDAQQSQPLPTSTAPPPDSVSNDPQPTPVPTLADPATATNVPTALPPTATVRSSTGLKDGTYTGSTVDAFYGLVQVQMVIQNGKIKNVQFLQYPNDRRTSVRINSVAVPDLQQEALQAQSANVDIVTGATLTSEAFIMSLQSALANAKG